MDSDTPWLGRLEKLLAFIAVPGLAAFLTGMNTAVGVLSWVKPEFPSLLSLDWAAVFKGEAWRLLTFLFIPPESRPLWLMLWLILYFSTLRMLESLWGDFKMTFYCLAGTAGTALASLLLGEGLSNAVFNLSLFLAFARLHPNFEILFFFLFPLKMKWLAAAAWTMTLWGLVSGSWATKISLLGGLSNYMLFFLPGHWRDLRLLWHYINNRRRF
jgi:hypothetical protein